MTNDYADRLRADWTAEFERMGVSEVRVYVEEMRRQTMSLDPKPAYAAVWMLETERKAQAEERKQMLDQAAASLRLTQASAQAASDSAYWTKWAAYAAAVAALAPPVTELIRWLVS